MCSAAILMLCWEKSNSSRAVFSLMCERSRSERGESPKRGGGEGALKDLRWISRAGQEPKLVGDAEVTRGRRKEGQDASVSQQTSRKGGRKCKPQKTRCNY